jgi:signal peptide peptidase SppA
MTYLFRVRERLFGRPLLLTPEYANVVVSALAERLNVETLVSGDTLEKYRRPNDRAVLDRRNGIVTYPIVGSMVHRGDGVSADSGVQSYTAMQNDLTALIEDKAVRGILLDLDTPGGEAAGLTEFTDFIMEARREKPIWGIANTSACSGGMWLAAACTKMFATKMSSIGSIGVVTMHTDMSKALEKKGIVTTYIYAGKHKVDGNSSAPLTDEVRAGVQAHVDQLYDQFVGAVADMRGIDEKTVRKTEAGVFSPEAALEIGLIDHVGSLGNTLKAFHEELAGPKYMPGYKHEDHMADFTQADIDRARTEGHAAGVLEGVKTERDGLIVALTSLSKEDPKIGLFVEGLQDNLSAATAAKFAAKVSAAAPKVEVADVAAPAKTATAAQVDAFMASNAPNVSDASVSTDVDPRAARLAEINGSMKAFNKSRGFAAR